MPVSQTFIWIPFPADFIHSKYLACQFLKALHFKFFSFFQDIFYQIYDEVYPELTSVPVYVKPGRGFRSLGCKEWSESLSSHITLSFIGGPVLIDMQRLSTTHWTLQGLRVSSCSVRFLITWPWREYPFFTEVNLTCRSHVPTNRVNNSYERAPKMYRDLWNIVP